MCLCRKKGYLFLKSILKSLDLEQNFVSLFPPPWFEMCFLVSFGNNLSCLICAVILGTSVNCTHWIWFTNIIFFLCSIGVPLHKLWNTEFPSCLGESFIIVLAAFSYCLLTESRFLLPSCQTLLLTDEYEISVCLMLPGSRFADKHDIIERPARCWGKASCFCCRSAHGKTCLSSLGTGLDRHLVIWWH